MNDSDYLIIGFFGISGILGIAIGTSIWTGYFKTWFLIERIPVLVPTAFYNGSAVFMGVACISVIPAWLIGEQGRFLFFGLTLPLIAIAIVLAIWQPGWIQPAWYRWLEENHEEIIPILKEDVRRTRPREWQRRVATQEGLEQWVEEVKRKHGLL